MEKLVYEDCYELAYAVSCDVVDFEDNEDLTIVAKYDEAKEILAGLIQNECPIISIDLEDPELDGYELEYYINVSKEGVWCSKGWNHFHNDYFRDFPTVAYILDNCSSKVIKNLETDVVFEVSLGEDDTECECDGNCEHCACNGTKNEIKVSDESSYYINGVKVNEEEYLRRLNVIERRVNDFLDTFNRIWF